MEEMINLNNHERLLLFIRTMRGHTSGLYKHGVTWRVTLSPENHRCAFIIKPKNREKKNTPV